MLLEPIYESIFFRRSYGWRPGRSAHTALRTIRSDFKGTNWIVLGNINKFFDTVNHGVLHHIMKRKIRDKKLLKLISGGLKAKIHMPYGNIEELNLLTPEGRILSSILSNIYLHRFDIWIGERIQQYNLGGKDNRSWVLLRNQGKMRKARPRSDPFDPLYRRMGYRRYGDNFLIAIRGALSDAKVIRRECETFLREKLKLLLNMERTHIKHIRGNSFLGAPYRTPGSTHETKIPNPRGLAMGEKEGSYPHHGRRHEPVEAAIATAGLPCWEWGSSTKLRLDEVTSKRSKPTNEFNFARIRQLVSVCRKQRSGHRLFGLRPAFFPGQDVCSKI